MTTVASISYSSTSAIVLQGAVPRAYRWVSLIFHGRWWQFLAERDHPFGEEKAAILL